MIDPELIRTFLAVVSEGGLTAAAGKLNRTASGVSMQLKRLEQTLGVRVLERSSAGIALTPAGMLLRERGEQLLRANNALVAELSSREPRGQIVLGAPSDCAPDLLGRLLPVLKMEFPILEPRIVFDTSRALRTRVADGVVDAAIVAAEPDTDEPMPLWSDGIGWFSAAAVPSEPLRVALLTQDCVLRDLALAHLAAQDSRHTVVLEASSMSALREAATQGFCAALLQDFMSAGLTRVTPLSPTLPHEICFALATSPHLNSASAGSLHRRLQLSITRGAARYRP